jgi:AAA15 family ATPase/GTPase
MSEHFIKNIEIKNFKCFEDFKAEGFGRVNLIGGKNNVGKTAFMEAICVNIYVKSVPTFYTTLLYITFVREKLEFVNKLINLKDDKRLFENIKSYDSVSNINDIKYEIINEGGIKKYKFIIQNREHIINVNDFSYERNLITSILFLDNKGFTNKFLQKVYIEVQKKDREEELNKFISSFDSNIEKFKMFDDSPECKLKNTQEYLKLSEFGDGLKHYISIICSLYACADGYLFIDEIDNGIHHSKLDKLWNIILTLAKEQNVQVFATTHSDECIRALVTANAENVKTYQPKEHILEDNEIQFIELGRVDGKVDSIIFDFKELENEVAQNMEIRGW